MKKKIICNIIGETISSNSQEAFTNYKKSNFGIPFGEKIKYSNQEALFLLEKEKIEIFLGKKKLSLEELKKKFQKIDKRTQLKYVVFKDLRERGYIVKTALKFGADFRVYEKGSGPGKKHSKWIVFVDHESKNIKWHEFSAKNRVAHSTKKNLLLSIVDEEGDISYYECSWIKP